MGVVLVRNAQVFDGWSETLQDADVLVEDGIIREVSDGRAAYAGEAEVIDCSGRVLLPGLIDAHVHVYAVDLDLTRAMRRPFSYVAHHASRFLRHMLETGFTTVRDVGGGDVGLAHALKDGLITGSRLIYGGRILSQTGGHADWRPGHEHDPSCMPCGCGMIDERMSIICDGPDEVLKASREELRRGASHIKIVASGGVASPTDPLSALQFSPDEIRAVVEETARHGSYVAAHCHPAGAIRVCAELGVRTIEHGTFMDRETAQIVKEAGCFVVPTLAIIDGLSRYGAELGLPPVSQAKLKEVGRHAVEGLTIARDAGIPIGYGTDLLGPLYTRNLSEFELRREVFSPLEILRQATSINAEIIQAKGKLGCIAVGACADIVVVDGDPFADIGVMGRGPAAMPFVMQAGRVIRNVIL